MLNIMLTDLLPIFVIMLLGFISGKKGEFTAENARSLNTFVLNYALPAALFVSIVKASKHMLLSDVPLLLVSLIVIIGSYFLTYYLCRKIFKRTKAEAAVAGLVGGAPTIGYLGFAVLEPIFGATATVGLVVAVVAIVVNAITIPIALYLLNSDLSTRHQAIPADPNNAAAVAVHQPSALIEALKEPVCWAPMLAVLIVLMGFHFPTDLDPIFDLIGKANAGVAVFAAGITLSTNRFELNDEVMFNTVMKLFIMPALMLMLGIAFEMEPHKIQMLVLCGALPPVFSGIIIASKYNTYVQTGTSSLAVATFFFMVTAPLWIWLSRLFAG